MARFRGKDARIEAATGLYRRFLCSEPVTVPTLEDAAMAAIVDGVVDRVAPGTSLGVSLPAPDPDPNAPRIALLTEAIALLDPVLARRVRSPGPSALSLAARCLYALYRETGDTAALRRAVGLGERAAAVAAPKSGPDPADPYPDIAHELSIALLDLAAHEEGTDALSRAVHHAVRAFRAPSASDRLKTACQSLLSRAFTALFQRTGEDEHREQALRIAVLGREFTEETVTAEDAYNLGAPFLAAHEATGSVRDLETAVVSLREAVDRDPRPDHLLSLARALRLMYPVNGDERVLRESVTMSRRALAAARPTEPGRHRYLEQAAYARLLSHAAHGGRGVVDVAVPLQRLAIGSLPEGHPGRLDAVGTLADIWLARYEKTRSTADLDGAVEATLTAMRLGRGRPDHHRHRARYGRGARLIYEDTGDVAHLDRGIHATLKALETDDLPAELKAAYLVQGAAMLLDRTEREPDAEMRQAARNMLFECSKLDHGDLQVRIECARRWADLAVSEESWHEAGLAYLGALTTMPRLTATEVSRQSQESALRRFSGMASLGAACSLNVGKAMAALTLLELGRSVLLTQEIALYDEVRALRTSAPDLARELAEELRTRDESAAALGARMVLATAGLPGDGRLADRHRVAGRNLQILRARIREVPGHERFMSGLRDEELLAESARGPIVVLNLSALRTDALVVRPDGVTVVPLPAVTPERVGALVDTFLTAAEDPEEHGGTAMLDALAWLWDHLAEPVLAVAAPPPGPDGPLPRLWWCPTGPLSHLPLHAAGHHLADDGRTVLDRVVSSYTPTITALSRVRARRTTPSAGAGLLAVAVGRTASGTEVPLPGAHSEAAAVAAIHPATTVLADGEATRARLLAELPRHPRAHFTCHTRSDPRSPSLSRLVLHEADDELTVGDIARLDLSSVELAYLSTCDAARPGAEIPDESVHIAGAFLIAGYPDVVGTLWPMPDATGRRLARHFHRRLAEGDDPARALHRTTIRARRNAPGLPVGWANLVHIGG
ncbi:CHAT domain-containing protein [Streptomyces antibioticus]|uniref:CHAT domain-containing protein n=1 Tax=Streptomyces antibioticus TaxID=1890 RepID=UPI0036D9ADD0